MQSFLLSHPFHYLSSPGSLLPLSSPFSPPQLGETILQMKEDFIMVHMHFCCSHCKSFILTGSRWACTASTGQQPQCKNFNLCET